LICFILNSIYERKKTHLILKGRVRSSRGSTLIQPALNQPRPQATVEVARFLLESFNGDQPVPLTAALLCKKRVQRHGYKGVTSSRILEKLSAGTSLSGQLVHEVMSLIKAKCRIMAIIKSQTEINVKPNDSVDSKKEKHRHSSAMQSLCQIDVIYQRHPQDAL